MPRLCPIDPWNSPCWYPMQDTRCSAIRPNPRASHINIPRWTWMGDMNAPPIELCSPFFICFVFTILLACLTVNRLYRCVTDVESMYLFRLPRQLVQTTKRSNRTTLYYIHLRVVVPRPTKYRIRLYFPLSPSCVWNWNNVRHSQTQSRITKSKKILRRKKDHEKVERPKWIGF